MEIRKKLIIPFLTFLGFMVVSANSVYKGIVHHETWRIALASIGGVVFIAFAILIVYTVVKSGQKAT